jgi:hypothetical protein
MKLLGEVPPLLNDVLVCHVDFFGMLRRCMKLSDDGCRQGSYRLYYALTLVLCLVMPALTRAQEVAQVFDLPMCNSFAVSSRISAHDQGSALCA